ncbi:aldo/keto reductase [Candidatus Halobonum tyrrellensis]|uniref:Oxidoreductase, aryl-alcohol dehydrogenase like protein n=1 Tax=Candidatus Halobonum tyrrellensis G22 TaxID=1324957 RepID=V4HLT2_9EURY|nr:aldo/keto reductase [Candidatus Halobonum tyrrellensis]ESP88864.1 oxidoreductase, aryl-alcohol dehydrogenase like protein [Candidatus Halobonum tyrrellensis G22]
MATASGTWGYRDRFDDSFGRTYFRRFGPGVVSSIGAGTYLGEPTDAVDDRYRAALTAALDAGINLVDTAVNYRCGRSERVVGDALRETDADREAVVLATKGGFLPFDGDRPDDPGAYVREAFLDPGLVDRADLARGSHCIAPGFLDAMLDRSLESLGVDSVDCYYVHNPETQLAERDRAAVYDQLEAAFETLEERRLAGDIGAYGVATWEAFRVPPAHEAHLDLGAVLARAEAAAASAGIDDPDDHGLRAIQLPFNVGMADAFTVAAHTPRSDDGATGADDAHGANDGEGVNGGTGNAEAGGERVSALEFAHREGLSVFASAALGQGELASSLPEEIAAELAGDTTAQRAVNFARSAPAVTAALVGTTSVEHVRENVAAGTFDPLGASAFDAVFE